MVGGVHVDLREKKWQHLVLSVILDLVSFGTFGLPLVGELLDLIWAPISAYLLHKLYDNRSLSRIQFWKEILPFTDIIPVASLNWAVEYTSIGRAFGKRFGLTRTQPRAPTRP